MTPDFDQWFRKLGCNPVQRVGTNEEAMVRVFEALYDLIIDTRKNQK